MTVDGISLSANGIAIDGQYYTVVNGYQSVKHGQFYIEYKNILSVAYVRRRSKNMFFMFILFASLLVTMLFLPKLVVNVVNLFTNEEIISTVIQGLTALCGIILAILALSKRAYIEFTFIGGVIRVPCLSTSKLDAMNLVSKIQARK